MFWKRKIIKWIKAEISDLKYWRDDVWRKREGCEHQYNACDNSIRTLNGVLYILENNRTFHEDRHKIYKSEHK